jgi:hypothetical protein
MSELTVLKENFYNLIKNLSKHDSYALLLPIIFKLRGEPVNLNNHFPFAPIFNKNIPKNLIIKTGRQCGKSTSIALLILLRTILINYYSILIVYPLYELARRFSNNYLSPLIRDSLIVSAYGSNQLIDNVLQKEFTNGSRIILSYAYLDLTRTLGVSADGLFFDEVQDLDPTFVPIITETISASKFGHRTFTGTARSYENTIEGLWRESSQEEFTIPCDHCTTNGNKTWNICSTEFHLIKMIGPYRDDISEERPGLVCYKCQQPINPKKGIWVARRKDKRDRFMGLHIPQVILPMHYASPDKWRDIKDKQAGKSYYTEGKFFNEVLGESYDSASGLVTYSDIKNAIKLDLTDINKAIEHRRKLLDPIVMGIDWGGSDEEGFSKTAISIAGLDTSRVINIFYYEILPASMSILEEANYIFDLYKRFGVNFISHDFNGRGESAEIFFKQNGIPSNKIFPFWYVGHMNTLMQYHAKTAGTRDYRSLNKMRSLMITCTAIKMGKVIFNRDINVSQDDLGIPGDFLNLVIEESNTQLRDTYLILKRENTSDDFCHAVNFCCHTIWMYYKNWPVPTADSSI